MSFCRELREEPALAVVRPSPKPAPKPPTIECLDWELSGVMVDVDDLKRAVRFIKVAVLVLVITVIYLCFR